MKPRHTWGETHPMPEPPRISDACSLVSRLLLLAVLVLAVICSTSCTLTIGPDGAKSFSIDGTQAARAIEILSDK